MKNFRIVSLIIALIIMSSLFIACDGGADITLPPEESTSPTVQNNTFVFVYRGTSVAPHAKMSELAAGLGDTLSYDESPSCLYQGLDKDYTYAGFKLRTYPENGIDYVLSICFTDDSVATPEGIMLGSTRSEVEAAYGASFTEQNGNMVYTKDKTELRFRFNGDSVSAIEYWAITE
jgi:hypothetical protein